MKVLWLTLKNSKKPKQINKKTPKTLLLLIFFSVILVSNKSNPRQINYMRVRYSFFNLRRGAKYLKHVENKEGMGLPYSQANKPACLSFMDAGRKQGKRQLITHSNCTSQSTIIFLYQFPVPHLSQADTTRGR